MTAPTYLRDKSLDHYGGQYDELANLVIEWPYHYCHVTTDMVQWILSHDNERELNDGRRTSHSTQRAWMESLQRQAPPEGLFLRSQVEAGSNLPDIGNKV